MRKTFPSDSPENSDPAAAEAPVQRPRRGCARFVWIAAAICLLAIAGLLIWQQRAQTMKPVSAADQQWPEPLVMEQQWSEITSAADYFRNNPEQPALQYPLEPDEDPVMRPYAVSMTLRGTKRAALEEAGVLPSMPEHPEQDFQVYYNGDGSLYKVVFRWSETHRQPYRNLTLTAAPKELHELGDATGGMPVTVTVRDGIPITAGGFREQVYDLGGYWGGPNTLTWQTEQGWYQLSAGWNGEHGSFTILAAMLNWFWAHPLDLTQFVPPPAATIGAADPAKYPDAFPNAMPDFAALGYAVESERLDSSHGRPVWYEGVYTRGDTRIRWTVDTGADADDWAACPGRPGEITQEALNAALADKDYVNLFIDTGPRPLMATLRLESGTSDDAWSLIQDLAE